MASFTSAANWIRQTLNTLLLYPKNRDVYKSINPLRDKKLDYYSVLSQKVIEEEKVLNHVNSGDIVIVDGLIEKLELTEDINNLCLDYFDTPYAELEYIHNKKTIEDLVEKSNHAKRAHACLTIQSSIMSRLLLPHSSKYYLELNPNLRLHLPYKFVQQKESYIESRIGRGKMNPHGQHKDSWRFHPENTLNVWVALTEVTKDNGLALLPESAEYHPRFNSTEQEIAEGIKTYPSLQIVPQIKKGSALLFKAELLHGSVINQTNLTRVAFSMRCTIEKPKFHRDFQYNYIGIEDGKFNCLLLDKIVKKKTFSPKSTDTTFQKAEEKHSSITPVSYTDKYIVLNIDGCPTAFPRRCPHAGADLLFGELDDAGNLLCPNHRLCIRGKSKPKGV